jgi:hypothetical protein
VEWIGYVESNGQEVWAKTWILGRSCIRCEPNDQGIVPYVGWSPTSVPHLLRGMSIAQNHLHEFRMRTTLARGLMDQIGFALDREIFVASRQTDILGLQRRYPGKVIVGIPGQDYVFGDPPDVNEKLYQGMQWITEESQSIGPANPLVWGGSPDPREKTATGAKIRTNASMWRIDTVSMNYTEQFVAPLHNKLIYLLQANLDEDAEVVVDGKTIVLTKDNIQGPYVCRADFKLELDYDDNKFLKAKALADDAILKAEKYPMLYPLGKIHHAQSQMYVAAGERDPSQYIEAPTPGMEGWFPGMGAGAAQAQAQAGAQVSGQRPQLGMIQGGRPLLTMPAAAASPPDQAMGQGSAQPNQTMQGDE